MVDICRSRYLVAFVDDVESVNDSGDSAQEAQQDVEADLSSATYTSGQLGS